MTGETSGRRCGTPSGYEQHNYRGEKACDACAAARREYDKRNRNTPEKIRAARMHARAQNRARTQLIRLHHDQYVALYQQAKRDLQQEQDPT